MSTNAIKGSVTGKGDTIGKTLMTLAQQGVLLAHENLKGKGTWYSVPEIARSIPSIPRHSPA